MNEKLKLIFKGILGICLYFGLSIFQTLPFELMGIEFKDVPLILKEIYNILCELIIILLIVLLFKNQIKKAWADLKKNHMKYFTKYLKYYIIALIVMMISNAYIFGINDGNIAENESNIRQMFALAPIYTYISAVLLAPVLEELTFRLSLKNILGSNWIFIIASGLIFGGLHIIGTYSGPTDLLYLIPYGSFGVAFAYILTKTNNIFVTIGFHLMHNGIIMALQIFTLLFT